MQEPGDFGRKLVVGNSATSRDVLAGRLECKNRKSRPEREGTVVVYMTMEGGRAARENRVKYNTLRKIMKEYAGEGGCYG